MSGRYKVEFERSAKKDLDRLDRAVRIRALRKITALADDPRPAGVVRLAGQHRMWRIRIGGYRVVYEIEDDRLIVTAVRIAKPGPSLVYRTL